MKIYIAIISLCISFLTANAQNLKVTPSPDQKKVARDANGGIASVIFESDIKNLEIVDESNDERLHLPNGNIVFLIKPNDESTVRIIGYPKRRYIIKTRKNPEYELYIKDILPNSVHYYTVTLPNRFPLSFTVEYLFSQSTNYGFRLSLGKQIGGYISYRWGKYKQSGKSIDNITNDGDVTNAKYLGYIREALTGGVRIGLLHDDILNSKYGLYLLVGGGYGKYGRQWENPTQMEGNIYFYSDFIKGFNGDLAIQCTVGNWIVLSAGADVILSKGRTSFDYQIGVGLNLNFNKLFKIKS